MPKVTIFDQNYEARKGPYLQLLDENMKGKDVNALFLKNIPNLLSEISKNEGKSSMGRKDMGDMLMHAICSNQRILLDGEIYNDSLKAARSSDTEFLSAFITFRPYLPKTFASSQSEKSLFRISFLESLGDIRKDGISYAKQGLINSNALYSNILQSMYGKKKLRSDEQQLYDAVLTLSNGAVREKKLEVFNGLPSDYDSVKEGKFLTWFVKEHSYHIS